MQGSRPDLGRSLVGCAMLSAIMLVSCVHRERVRELPPRPFPAPPAPAGELRILDPLLTNRIASLRQRSATWDAAMDSLRATGFEVVIAQPEQIRAEVPGLERYAAQHVGEVLPLRNDRGELIGAVVTVDVPRLRRLWRRTGLPPSVLAVDIDRILIHEVYGHVLPLAQSRKLSGGCPDPGPGQPASSSCAIRRENRIRAELGLERRTTYDLRGLATGRALEDAEPHVVVPEPDHDRR